MKVNVTLIAALLFSMPLTSRAYAADNIAAGQTEETVPTHFILCLKDGEKVEFLLKNNPRVVNGDGFITVVDNDMTIEYPLGNVHKYMLGIHDEYTAVKNDEAPNGNIQNQIGTIRLSGFGASESVVVTSINGTVVFESETNDSGSLSISTATYPSGIYILKIKNQTLKFIKR